MVFGVFDYLHKGHRYFLKQAKELGNKLIIIVARDSSVRLFKNKSPEWNELKRKEMLENYLPDAIVELGDEEQGRYNVVLEHKPGLICLGYDQQKLESDLKEKISYGLLPEIPIMIIKPHNPEQYKSSKYV